MRFVSHPPTPPGPRTPGARPTAKAAILSGARTASFDAHCTGTDPGLLRLLGLGLSPVIVGGTEVIVGNAPVELAGVAGGLQSTAMQVGGTIGTAVLGAVMSAKVSSLLPGRWAAAHLPALSTEQLASVKSATTPVPSAFSGTGAARPRLSPGPSKRASREPRCTSCAARA